MSVRAVCFDLGGVVIRICRSLDEAIVAASLPVRPRPNDRESLVRQRALVDRHQRGEIRSSAFHELLAGEFDGAYSSNEISAIHAAVLCGEYDGIEATIRAIGDAGLITACLSNTSEDHWNALVAMPALQALRGRHASHLWGLIKPDAAIYRRFEAEHGVSGAEILFFDDLEENVLASAALGWDAVQIDHTGDTAAQVRNALAVRGINDTSTPTTGRR
jgi:glucose-1-phosphatase